MWNIVKIPELNYIKNDIIFHCDGDVKEKCICKSGSISKCGTYYYDTQLMIRVNVILNIYIL